MAGVEDHGQKPFLFQVNWPDWAYFLLAWSFLDKQCITSAQMQDSNWRTNSVYIRCLHILYVYSCTYLPCEEWSSPYCIYLVMVNMSFTICPLYLRKAVNSDILRLDWILCTCTFHGSFEEDFAASTRHNTIVASWGLVSTNQAHFGCRGRLSQWWAERRNTHTHTQVFRPDINQTRFFRSQQQSQARLSPS